MNPISAVAVRIGDLFRAIWQRILEEPVYTQGVVVAAIALGTAFGLNWNGAQVGAVSAFSAAVLSLLTRRAVTPVQQPTLEVGTPVNQGSAVVASRIPPPEPVAVTGASPFVLFAACLLLGFATTVQAKKPPELLLEPAVLEVSPTNPSHGDTLTVQAGTTNGVFNVTCWRPGTDTVIYGAGGNARNPSVVLASLAWQEGPASCVVRAREYDPQTGLVRTVGEVWVEVAG